MEFFQHFNAYLISFLAQHHHLAYLIVFLVIFLETGILFAALLPGDSLLIAVGALAIRAPNALNIHILFLLLVIATIAGNCLNYCIGRWFGTRLFTYDKGLFLNKNHLEKAHRLYASLGSKIILVACFIPIIRTFVPFTAGLAAMAFGEFFAYSVLGALGWIGLLLYGSYYFTSIPIIKEHLTMIIVGLILIVFIVPSIQYLRNKRPSI